MGNKFASNRLKGLHDFDAVVRLSHAESWACSYNDVGHPFTLANSGSVTR